MFARIVTVATVVVAVTTIGLYAHYQIRRAGERTAVAVEAYVISEYSARWQRQLALLADELDITEPDAKAEGGRVAARLSAARSSDADLASVGLVVGDTSLVQTGEPPQQPFATIVETWRQRGQTVNSIGGMEIGAGDKRHLYLVREISRRPRGTPAAYLVASYSLRRIGDMGAKLRRHMAEESRRALELIVVLGIAIPLLAIAAVIARTRRRDSGPADATRGMLPAGSASGGRVLDFEMMAEELSALLRETAEKSILDRELQLAQSVQIMLMPPQDQIERGAVSLAGNCYSAGKCGGDWWTFCDLAGGKLLLAIGDVTGHGVSAAMITAAAKAAFCLASSLYRERTDVIDVIKMMNEAVYHVCGQKLHMTCFVALLDPETRTIAFTNAGHRFPCVHRRNAAAGEFEPLVSRGNRLGDSLSSEFSAVTKSLRPNDTIVFCTDGLVECVNARGEQYGERRLRASIGRASDERPAQLRDAIFADVRTFCDGIAPDDDMALIALRLA